MVIGDDPEHSEVARVADKGSIVLDRPLTRDHPAGTAVFRLPDEQADLVPPPSPTDANTDRASGGEGVGGGVDSSDGGGSSIVVIAVAVAVALIGGGAFAIGRRRQIASD